MVDRYSPLGIIKHATKMANNKDLTRKLVVKNRHYSETFINITVEERNWYKMGTIPIFPKKGKIVYSMPVKGVIGWNELNFIEKIEKLKTYTRDSQIIDALEQEHSALFDYMNS